MKAIRTEGHDLVNTTHEFSHDIVDNLGLRAFDPEEVERNVEQQLEKQLGLDPNDIIQAVKQDATRRLASSAMADLEDVIVRSLRLAKQDMLRLRNDEFKRREELMVRIKLLQDLLPAAHPPRVVPSSSSALAPVLPIVLPVPVPSSSSSSSPAVTTASTSRKKKRMQEEEEEEEELGGVTTTTTTTSANQLLTCPQCNTYQTTSLRQLNVHLNGCLEQEEEDAEEEDEEEGYDEDDILDGETRAERRKRRTKEGTAKTRIEKTVEDDWDPAYCKRRLQLHSKAIKAWILSWNNSVAQHTDAAVAHAQAEKQYEQALEQAEESRRLHLSSSDEDDDDSTAEDDDGAEDLQEPMHTIVPDQLFIPQRLFNRLLPHQKETLPWLFHHHTLSNGAILGDEMGLGKTAQAIAFLASLKCSNKLREPCLIIAPATTLSQWVQECNEWFAPFRIFVLHDSFRVSSSALPRTGPEVVSRAFDEHEADIILTTFKGLQIHSTSLLPKRWSYVVLDEAHNIRNPEINVTFACKQVQTCHRIALTGAPIQNKLKELWSLFDFVCPRRLGTLPMFEQYFAEPIRLGGMMGATPHQVFAAYAAAKSLRDSVTPFMLRRMKKDVATSLPKKTELVLFCNLTPVQREAYVKYLKSEQVNQLLLNSREDRRANTGKAWRAIATLRKICNHPDLLTAKDFKRPFQGGYKKEESEDSEEEDVDIDPSQFMLDMTKSAKMILLNKVLQEWRREGHKVLVFCQGTKMLTVLENYAKRTAGWPTMRMDGTTPVKKRQLLISQFNRGAIGDTFLFLLTTRVGGVGVNLTGATRVIIFDPDWNPSTDAQARERAWRLGQTKPVTVYRFIVTGTIEEKIYHRQIFKTFLTNKVLHDPSRRRFFKDSDLRDLFTLTDNPQDQQHGLGGATDTSDMFSERVVDLRSDDDEDDEGPGSRKKKKKSSEENDQEKTDNALLKHLFKSDQAFTEAFDHDRVELAATSQTEKLIAEKRAKLAAEKARKRFLEEQKRLLQQPVNVPTYTGGARSAPPTAAALLAGGNLWQQQDSSSAGPTTSSSSENVHVQILSKIHEHLRKAGKRGAFSAELMQYGEKYLKNVEGGIEIFRWLLKSVAEFDENKKKWFLKKKYQTDSPVFDGT